MSGPDHHARGDATGLVGRAQELARIEALLDGARLGTSGALVLTGGAGIGKTTLLRRARELAAGDMLVLRAEGIEQEAELPYAGLSDLLRPALPALDAIPEVQASALRAALALERGDEARRFAVPAAVLSLLSAAAEERPVLVTIDDARWLDEESFEAIAFAARRLRAEGVVVLIAARTATPGERVVAGIEHLAVGPLARDDARALLRRGDDRELDDAVAERLLDTADGNPLALLELPAALTADQRAGAEPVPAPLPVGDVLHQTLARVVAALPETTQHAMLVAATVGVDGGHVLRTLERLGLPADALDAAEDAGLLTIGGNAVAFRHPLLRSVAYHAGTGARRRAAHAAAAAEASNVDERAWHLASAAVGPDAEAAAALEAAANAAERRGALAPAAHAYERASELASGDDRARLGLAACEAHTHAGHLDRVPALAATALAYGGDPFVEAGLERAAARAAVYLGDVGAAVEQLGKLSARLAPTEPQRAAEVELERVGAFMIHGDPPGMFAAAERVHALGDEPTRLMADLVVGEALIVGGAGDQGDAMLDRCADFLDVVDPLAVPIEVLGMAGHSSLWVDRFDRAERVLDRIIGELRDRSAPGTLSYPLAAHAHLDFRRGRWAAAHADADEAVRLAEDVGEGSVLAFSLAALALLQAGRGDDASTETAARARTLAQQLRGDAIVMYADRADGLAALGRGDAAAAIDALERLRTTTLRLGALEPGFLQWHGDLIEAHVRAGDRERAEELLAELEDAAAQPWRRWAATVADRSRGLLASDDDFEAHFASALERHRTLEMPFEHARTLLALGERRRRSRRRADAREPLRAALELFERLGAGPWSTLTRDELRASGTQPRRTAQQSRDELSAHELRIAMLVSEGMTNREVAAALFLSPKTIEHHLSQIYRKTGVRSRTQLSRVMSAELEHERTPG